MVCFELHNNNINTERASEIIAFLIHNHRKDWLSLKRFYIEYTDDKQMLELINWLESIMPDDSNSSQN